MKRYGVILLILAMLLLAIGFWWRQEDVGGGSLHSFKPPRATIEEITGQPKPVTFPDLNGSPELYHDQLIRITGQFVRISAPPCLDARGIRTRWGLAGRDERVDATVRLDAIGFEQVVRLVPKEAHPTMTVDGFWRLYYGPIGCGKKAQRQYTWYLDVVRIVSPNPFPNLAPLGTVAPTSVFTEPVGIGTTIPTIEPTADEQVETATIEPTPTTELGQTVTATATPFGPTAVASNTPILLPTVTTQNSTPTSSPTSVPSGSTATATVTPTATGVIIVLPSRIPSRTPSPTPSRTPLPVGTSGPTSTPGAPGATPTTGGYPPQPSPIPTTVGYP